MISSGGAPGAAWANPQASDVPTAVGRDIEFSVLVVHTDPGGTVAHVTREHDENHLESKSFYYGNGDALALPEFDDRRVVVPGVNYIVSV